MAERYPRSPEQCGPDIHQSTIRPQAIDMVVEPSEPESRGHLQFRIIDQSESSQHQQPGSIPADKHGLVADRPITSVDVDQSDTTGGHHGQVSDQPDFANLLQQALQSTQTGAATVNLIQTQYNVSGEKAVIQGTQHNVAGGQTVIEGDHNISTITTGETKPLASEVSKGHSEMLNLTKCQEELRTSYLDDFGHVNLLPWIPDETKDMESIFVELELVRKGEQSYHKIECSEELVNLKRSRGQRVNRVLITGDAGGGKSTLLANIAYKWALNDPQSPLSKFSLVFLLRMKDVESSSSLVDLIFENILSDDSTVSKEGLGIYIKENAGDILFLIDGLDEDSCHVVKNKSGEVAQLLHNRILRKSCVILTSRPEYISNLKEHVSYYLQVKLEGFSSSSIIEYITKFFGDAEEKISSLLVRIESEPHIEVLISIPVLLLMVCFLWEDQSRMPKTKTQLYKETVRYMWKRYIIRSSGDPFIDDSEAEELNEDLNELLIKLGGVALRNRSIDVSRLTYTESDFGNDVCSLGCKVGILKKERSRLGLEKKTTVAFLHATFLEFCTAFHIAFLLQSKRAELEDFTEKLFDFQSNCISYPPLLLEFCCGLHPQTTTNFFQWHMAKEQQRIDSLSPDDESIRDVPIAWHLANIFESQYSPDHCAQLLFPPSFGFFLDICHSDIASVLYISGLYKGSGSHKGILSAIKSLKVSLCYTPSWIPDLMTYTTNLQRYIGYVSSSSTRANPDILYRALSRLSKLSHVDITNANLIKRISYDITNLIKFFTEKRIRLVYLLLAGFHYDDKVMAKYLSSISTSIVHLALGDIQPSEERCISLKGLSAILPTLKQLCALEFVGIQIGSAVKNLRPIIRQIENLTLRRCGIKEKHLKELLTFLSRGKKLRNLNLSNNAILFSGSLVGNFVDTLNQLPVLEELQVHDSGLGEESERFLLKFAKEKSSMRELYLHFLSPIDVQGSSATSC